MLGRGFEVLSKKRVHTSEITLPVRSTEHSAGYDFFIPYEYEGISIEPGEKLNIWTDVKAYMNSGEVLMVYLRSSLGVKHQLSLANGTGIIDGDYYDNENNEGNIGLCIRNCNNKRYILKGGERIAQGVFIPFMKADDDNTTNTRKGGYGSSGK